MGKPGDRIIVQVWDLEGRILKRVVDCDTEGKPLSWRLAVEIADFLDKPEDVVAIPVRVL